MQIPRSKDTSLGDSIVSIYPLTNQRKDLTKAMESPWVEIRFPTHADDLSVIPVDLVLTHLERYLHSGIVGQKAKHLLQSILLIRNSDTTQNLICNHPSCNFQYCHFRVPPRIQTLWSCRFLLIVTLSQLYTHDWNFQHKHK